MQFYNFIFLARSWASDRVQLSAGLSWLARRAEKEDSPFTFILYPEGTLVSKDTRPISKKYADKLGIVRNPFPTALYGSLPFSSTARYGERPSAALDWSALLPPLACPTHTQPRADRHYDGIPRRVPPQA